MRQILVSIVEAKFHLFQVQQELGAGDAIVTFQLGLGMAPEILNAVDMLALPSRKGLAVIDAVVP
jgi:hypothetical protein